MSFVRTVLGDVAPDKLGRVNYHEHLFQVTPLLPGDELDDEVLSQKEAALMAASGFEAYIDATPCGLGRRPSSLARISAATGLGIVMTTGLHNRAHYRDDDPLVRSSVDELSARFLKDLTDGAEESPACDRTPTPQLPPEGAPVRAGIIKIGLGYWSIDTFTGGAIEAAGQAHGRTGAPIMVHLEHGSATHEVLDRLDAVGIASDRVILAHVDRNPDPGLHLELAARGAYLGYDGPARHREWPDSVLIDCMAAVATRGGERRLLLGGDVARRSRYVAYGGLPGLAYLGDRFVPRLAEMIGRDALERILRQNPAALLTWGQVSKRC